MKVDIKIIEEYCKNNAYVTIPEIQQEYGIGYREARSLIDGLIAKDVLKPGDGLKFVYQNDSDEDLFIEDEDDEDDEDEDSYDDDEDDDDGYDEDKIEGGTVSRLRFLIEKNKDKDFFETARKNLLSRLLDGDDVRDSEKDKLSEDDMKRNNIIKYLSQGIDVSFEENEYIVNIDICYPDDTAYKITLKNTGDKFEFSDNCFTFNYLKSNLDMTQDKYKNKVKTIIEKYGILLANDELTVKIEEPILVVKALIFFIVAIEHLTDIVTGEFIHQIFGSLEAMCINKSKELFASARKASRREMIEKVEEHLRSAEKTNNLTEVEIYRQILEGYKNISDEYFEEIKQEYLMLIDNDD